MKKVIYRHSTSRQLLFSVAFLFSFTFFGFAQNDASQDTTAADQSGVEASAEQSSAGSDLGDPAAGKELFNSL
ncbi:MAG: cytochrome C, partial [Christiangramia sp.]|nr:cytochrome C [Christiangramia sp.]